MMQLQWIATLTDEAYDFNTQKPIDTECLPRITWYLVQD